ncbi:MAG: protein kinase [Acidobacteriota bacterium]
MSETPFSILLVDDSEVNQEIWPAMLEGAGYRALSARSGEPALDVLQREFIDLVLLDIVMPGMSGLEVLETLRSRHSAIEIPVIMATSKSESEDMVRAFELGANDYVTKPLDVQVTLARIQAQLRGRLPRAVTVGGASTGTATEPTPAVAPGVTLEGRYLLESLIGRGNFGTVYRARHLVLDRPVAVKILRTGFGGDDVTQARFRQEGISLSRVQHPNAVAVLDFSSGPQLTFLVMELLSGHSLDEELAREGRLSTRRAAEILIPVCSVLAEAHSSGIIHRDIKPQNIFLHRARRGETVKVLDFGIAKLVGEAELAQQLTVEGSSVGTPAYMAPERFMNDPYDGRADIYSVAVMLYEMLSGRTPFAHSDGNFFKLIRMHVIERPKPLRAFDASIPRELEEIVLAGLEKKPEDRPTVHELATRFGAAVGLGPIDLSATSSDSDISGIMPRPDFGIGPQGG